MIVRVLQAHDQPAVHLLKIYKRSTNSLFKIM